MRQPPPTAVGIPILGEITQKLGTSSEKRAKPRVPLGNVYYYFKTKDEFGEAIVELRLAELAAQRQRWSEAGSPKDRLCACVQDVFEPATDGAGPASDCQPYVLC